MTLKLNGSSSGSVSIDAPASTTGGADVTLTLPVNDGDANQLLQTNGSGVLSWAGGGKVLQVVANNPFQSTNAINISHNSGGAVGPSDLGADVKLTITPSAATSKILYFAQLSSVGGANSGATIQINTILYRHISGGSATATGASCGTYVENNTYTPHMIVHLDSPNTTNAIEYKLYGSGNYATGGQYAWQRTTGSTQIVALEIGA